MAGLLLDLDSGCTSFMLQLCYSSSHFVKKWWPWNGLTCLCKDLTSLEFGMDKLEQDVMNSDALEG